MVQRGAAARPLLRAAGLPDRYDLRDPDPANSAPSLVTAVRDQGPYNTCWAFSTMAALESRLLSGGATWDLSEDNLITRSGFGPFAAGPYAIRRQLPDVVRLLRPLGRPADRDGRPVPHAGDEARSAPSESTCRASRCWRRGRARRTTTRIKSAVMSYGAVATQMYYPASDGGVYDAATHAFYYAGGAEANHGVAIVGWDDTYSAATFRDAAARRRRLPGTQQLGRRLGRRRLLLDLLPRLGPGACDLCLALQPRRPPRRARYARAYGYDKLGWTSSIGLTGTADPGVARFASRFTARRPRRSPR